MFLVQKGVFPNMNHYTTVLKNVIEAELVSYRLVKVIDKDGNEKTAARRYWIKGWSLIEYIKQQYERKTQVVEIREGVDKK